MTMANHSSPRPPRQRRNKHRHTITVDRDTDVALEALAVVFGAKRSGIAALAFTSFVKTTVPGLGPDLRARFEEERRRLEAERHGPAVASTAPTSAQPASAA